MAAKSVVHSCDACTHWERCAAYGSCGAVRVMLRFIEDAHVHTCMRCMFEHAIHIRVMLRFIEPSERRAAKEAAPRVGQTAPCAASAPGRPTRSFWNDAGFASISSPRQRPQLSLKTVLDALSPS